MPTENGNKESKVREGAEISGKAWKNHLYRVGSDYEEFDGGPPEDKKKFRDRIKPWLTAVFQSEHLSLLLGSGFTQAVASTAGEKAADMGDGKFDAVASTAGEKAADMRDGKLDVDFGKMINEAAKKSAEKTERGSPNIEDYLRVANELLRGLEIQGHEKKGNLESAIKDKLSEFLKSILSTEKSVYLALGNYEAGRLSLCDKVVSFLLSFASRAASRERLNLFTTNYDRLIEYGCDLAGLHVIDRFVGALMPIFRAGRLNVDLHYNPPGMRGEPRYMEGVIRLFKLHGSLDWRQEGRWIRRYGIPFGESDHPDIPKDHLNTVMIYPNAAKDMETLEYPYAELFRDFAAAVCRPNSSLVTYGYGFGDDHVNRVIRDMLTIPSTHLVIISYDNRDGRIEKFCNGTGHQAQVSLLIGNHFGNLPDLVENYLPKPAIDLISARRTELLRRQNVQSPGPSEKDTASNKPEQEGQSNDVAN